MYDEEDYLDVIGIDLNMEQNQFNDRESTSNATGAVADQLVDAVDQGCGEKRVDSHTVNQIESRLGSQVLWGVGNHFCIPLLLM